MADSQRKQLNMKYLDSKCEKGIGEAIGIERKNCLGSFKGVS